MDEAETSLNFSDYNWYWLGAIVLLTLCSVITRSGYFLLGDRLPLPESLRQALRYAPVSALAAIIVPELLPWQGQGWPRVGPELFAAVAAVLVYLRTRNTFLVIVLGMVVLWGLKAL